MDHENDIAYCSVLARSVKPLTFAKFFETIVKQDISKSLSFDADSKQAQDTGANWGIECDTKEIWHSYIQLFDQEERYMNEHDQRISEFEWKQTNSKNGDNLMQGFREEHWI